MSVSIAEFWKLLVDSRLLPVQQCQQLNTSFQSVKGADTQGNAKTLAQWLISLNHITHYQATILLGGRTGPFFYGDYKIYDRIAAGRLEGCFRAVHCPTGHPVLIQFINSTDTQNPELWSAAVSHALAHCETRHPNLNQCHEPVDLVTYRFLVMEDLQGQSADELLRSTGPIHAAEACRFIRLTAMGLARLHQNNQIHGDVRPWNMWVEPTGNVKLLRDPFDRPAPLNFAQPSNQLLLRSDYLAPEFTQPGKQPDVLTDIYALGCSFYQLLTGRPPFPGGDAPQKLGRHAAEPIQPLEPFGVPQQVAQMVTYMMAKNPGVRYQQIDTVVEQLNTYVAPENLQPRPQTLPPTLHSFEHWIKQKQQSLSHQPKPQAAVPGPTATQGPSPTAQVPPQSSATPIVTPQPPADAVTGGAAAAGILAAAAASAASSEAPAGINIAVDPPSPSSAGSPPADAQTLKEIREKKRAKLLAIWLAATAGVLILALILFKTFSSNPNEVAQAPDETNVSRNGDSQDDPGTNNEIDDKGVLNDGTGSQAASTDNGTRDVVDNNGATTTTSRPGTNVGIVGRPSNSGTNVVTEIVDDSSGKLLWASPTKGNAIRLNYVPPDSRLTIIARLSDLKRSPQGPLVLEALGPMFHQSLGQWQRDAGVVVDDVEQLIFSLHEAGDSFPKPSYVVHLTKPMAKDKLLSRWGNPSPEQVGSATIYKGRQFCFYAADGAGN